MSLLACLRAPARRLALRPCVYAPVRLGSRTNCVTHARRPRWISSKVRRRLHPAVALSAAARTLGSSRRGRCPGSALLRAMCARRAHAYQLGWILHTRPCLRACVAARASECKAGEDDPAAEVRCQAATGSSPEDEGGHRAHDAPRCSATTRRSATSTRSTSRSRRAWWASAGLPGGAVSLGHGGHLLVNTTPPRPQVVQPHGGVTREG